jgi:hypothetical protein
LRSRRLRRRDVAAQHHLPLPAQHVAAFGGEPDRLVLALHREQSLRQQLADDPAPFGLAQVGAHPEHRQLVMPVLRHLLRLTAKQDVDDLARAEPLAVTLPVQPHDRGQHLLRGDRAVPGLRW